MRRNRLLRGLKIAAIATVGVAVFGEVVMQLWNWLTPSLFGWHVIGFWQALGLVFLSRILFGGFRGGGGFRGPWRRRMMERWEQMTPEQREQFRQGMRSSCFKPETSSPSAV